MLATLNGFSVLVCIVCYNIVTVAWNGSNITGPVLIYHDELVVDNCTNGTLICTSQDQYRVGWHNAVGTLIGGGDFEQIRTECEEYPSVSRLSITREVSRSDAPANGLWTCRLNGEASAPTPFPVGIYEKGKYIIACQLTVVYNTYNIINAECFVPNRQIL